MTKKEKEIITNTVRSAYGYYKLNKEIKGEDFIETQKAKRAWSELDALYRTLFGNGNY